MDETLPAAMIAQLEELRRALVAISSERRDASLATLEAAVLDAVRAVLPGLLTTVVQASARALQAPHCYWRQPCRCQQWARVQSWRPRTVLTICGAIQWERPWYVCDPCGQGFSPADTTLEVEPRARLSAGLCAWLEDLGASHSFGRPPGGSRASPAWGAAGDHPPAHRAGRGCLGGDGPAGQSGGAAHAGAGRSAGPGTGATDRRDRWG
jgi:hypothetical protein